MWALVDVLQLVTSGLFYTCVRSHSGLHRKVNLIVDAVYKEVR